MRRLCTSALLLLAAAAVAGCSRYPDFKWGQGTSWADARALAHQRQAADRAAQRTLSAGPGRHLVMPGDTVSGLAARYGVPMRQIVERNGLKPPYRIYVGQVLEIGPAPVAEDGRVHRVQRGETLSAIALHYGVPLGELVAANPGIHPDRLLVGQRIRLPTPEDSPTTTAAAAQPAPTAPVADAPPPVPPEAYRRAAETPAPPLSREGFLWPVEGQVIDRFGPKPNGLRNDGVNIAAPAGTPVRAAESGVVVYAGEAIPAFGRMLMLRHDGGWLTAYAHNATLLVTVGDVVRRGQVIARVGATGDVSSPQLHFQVRKGTEPIDPVAFFSSSKQLAQR